LQRPNKFGKVRRKRKSKRCMGVFKCAFFVHDNSHHHR